MFSAVFYKHTKRVNSTLQPSSGTSYSIDLKADSSVLTPTIELDLGQGGNPSEYNYCYIEEFHRYYWVTWTWRNRLWVGSCKVDSLASWKSYIGSYSGYVGRAASSYDGNIQDLYYPAKANPTATEQILPNIRDALRLTSTHTGAYIVGTISGDNNTGVRFNHLTNLEFKQFLDFMFSGSYLSATDISQDLQKELINPFQYVASCMWFPFLEGGGGHFGDTVKFGFWDSGVYCYPIPEDERTFSIMDPIQLTHHPQRATRGAYLDNNPFTRRQIEVFGFGSIPIDSSYFVNSDSCSVMVKVDKFTGIGELTVEAAGATVLRTQSQVGVPIKLSQITQSVLSPAIAAVGAVGSAITGNFVGAVSGIGNVIQSAMPQVQTSGSTGSNIDFLRVPRITSQFYNIVDEDLASRGRPLCKAVTLSTLSGYIKCEDADPAIPCTDQELSEIVSYLNGGFYYE